MRNFFVSLLVFWGFQFTLAAPPVFRFHLVNEPGSLKPWEQKNSAAGYLLSQLTGTLLTFQDHHLNGNLAENCRFKTATVIQCLLRKKIAWSDGQAITAQDFVRSFQELLDPQNHAFRADLLFSIENAKQINAGKLPKSKLQVSAPKSDLLEIHLESPDSEFLYTLTSPLLAPLPSTPLVGVEELRKNPELWKSSGPYTLSGWEAQKKISLKPNLSFWKKSQRPDIEILTIAEDSVALNLYEKSELSFLRRLPTLFIPKYKGRPDFFEIEQIRFDYIGFSEKWKNLPDLRLALAKSLQYTDLQNLFQSKGRPGCVGIPDSLHNEKICHDFALENAKNLWSQIKEKPKSLELLYSKQGGDDHKRSMEWLQAEWKKNLGLDLKLNALENKIFIERLEKNPPDLFRKGLAPERPTCLSALENFETDNSENYIQFSNKEFDQILTKMRGSQKNSQKKKLCDKGLHLLMDQSWIIPTGPIHFTLLAQTQWQGWKLNELNQLDLSELHFVSGDKSH